MEFGCSADIELPLVNCNIGAGLEFPECCTRYQQKIFALEKEKQKERNCHRRLAKCNMASSDRTTAEDYLATKQNITRLSGGSVSSTISYNDRERHVHFGDEIVVQECSIDRLHRNDPNESAADMIEAYKRECTTMKVRPISKLLEQLAKLDQLSTPIDTLDLRNCKLDNRSCEALEAVLSRMHMTTLDLERTGLEDEGMIALCEMVEFYECASRLNFTGSSKLRARAWFFLGKMLKKVSFIEMLDVKQCALDEQALTSMLRAVRANCTLRILHLEGNNLTGKGVFILMAAMKFNENLMELFLGGNRIVPEDCQNIGNILRTNHTLTHLDLRDNSIQNAGLRYVCAGIAEQQVGLLSLNIATNGITPEGMHHVAVMLPCTKSLQEINLCNNRVGDYGIMMAKLSLLANRSLLKLTLCNTRITCEGAIALAEFVAESRMLEQLDLRDNDIRIAGLLALSLAHKMNHKLYRLSMPRTIKIEPRDKEMARNLIDNIEEYMARNMKEYQERQKQQQQDEADAVAAAIAASELDEVDEPPPRTAAELEEEEQLISALKTESSQSAAEDPFSSEDIIDNPEATPGKDLEKALDSLILITKGTEPSDNDTSPSDESLSNPAAAATTTQQEKSLSFDLLTDSSGSNFTAPLLELTPSSASATDNTSSDSPTLPDLLGESPPKNQALSEFSHENSVTSQLTNNNELNITPDLMLEDNPISPEMPLDIASNVNYPPLDLLSSDEASGQLVDVTQGTGEGDLLLANEAPVDSHSSNPTPDVSQVGQSQHVGLSVDLVDGHNTSVLCSPLHADNTNTRRINDNGPLGSEPL